MPDMVYEKHSQGNYAVFTMNRPDRLNAQGSIMAQELEAALHDFTNDPAMRAGILTGAGRAFSAGADLREMAERNDTLALLESQLKHGEITIEEYGQRLLAYQRGGSQPFSGNPKPFIAAVNGLAIGAGMERATDCDIRIASTNAYFGLFEVKRGIMAGYGIHNMARVMPFGEAMYLMLTGDTMTSEDARRIGFVHEVVAPERLMSRAIEVAVMIAENAPLAVQGTKAVAQFWRQFGREESLRMGAWVSRHVMSSEDAREGPRAFAEKRPPVWKGG